MSAHEMDADLLDEAAREILRGNDRGGYTVPTDGLYPYQWNWDSAFTAWGLAEFDLPRAWVELETLMSGRWPDGMVPHILFHQPDPSYFPGPDVWGTDDRRPIASSGISQPPVAATVARALLEQDPEAGAPRARALFAPLADWHRWFMTWRSDGGAICATHPWEGGRDNAPDWDGAMAAIDPADVGEYRRRDTSHVDASMRPTRADYDRYVWLVQRGKRLGWDEAKMLDGTPFRVADPLLTFILLRANRDLSAIGRALGEDTAEIDGWAAELENGAATLWNPALGAYDSRNVLTDALTGSLSDASFLCWYAGIDDPRALEQAQRVWDAVPYPVPSFDPADPRFDPRRYWRGPTWPVVNAMIACGLADCGHAGLAGALRGSSARLIAEGGFSEYFDPVTGDPAGGTSFSWTAAVWLRWASPNAASD
jgi:mannosylglycerate hydrolase